LVRKAAPEEFLGGRRLAISFPQSGGISGWKEFARNGQEFWKEGTEFSSRKGNLMERGPFRKGPGLEGPDFG